MQPWIEAWELELPALHPARRGLIRTQQNLLGSFLSRSAFRRTRSGPSRSTNKGGQAPGFQPDGRFCYRILAKLSSPSEPL
jgi:hypothetical protein